LTILVWPSVFSLQLLFEFLDAAFELFDSLIIVHRFFFVFVPYEPIFQPILLGDELKEFLILNLK